MLHWFYFTALYAGTNPASNQTFKLMKAAVINSQPTLWSLMKYSSKLLPINFKVKTPKATPINPEITVITILS